VVRERIVAGLIRKPPQLSQKAGDETVLLAVDPVSLVEGSLCCLHIYEQRRGCMARLSAVEWDIIEARVRSAVSASSLLLEKAAAIVLLGRFARSPPYT
jgi:hypothetical protein